MLLILVRNLPWKNVDEIFYQGRSLIYGTSIRNRFEFYCTSIFGGQGRDNGEMTDPSGLYVDSGGNIINADSKNDRIQVNRINTTEEMIDYSL